MNKWDEKYRWYEEYCLNRNNIPTSNITLNDCIVSYTNTYDKNPIKPKERAPMKNGWITAKNGDRKHYLNDRLHNDNGPAFEGTNGIKLYYKNGKLHREDGPAYITEHYKYYYLNGQILSKYDFDSRIAQRKKLEEKKNSIKESPPEIKPITNPIIVDGTKYWYLEPAENRVYHRLDGPAIEYAIGSKEWWQNGKLHRLDGPAIESCSGNKSYYINGLYYPTAEKYWQAVSLIPQEDIWGNISYYTEGKKLHRLDGPAFTSRTGAKQWYKHGLRHRLDGPAIENMFGCHLPLYWIDGIGYETKEDFDRKVLELQGKSTVTSVVNQTVTITVEQKHSNEELADMTKPVAKYKDNSMTSTPVTFLTKLQQNAKAAGPRILCKTISRGARAALIHLMKSKRMKKSWVRTVSEMMETEYGLAVVSFGLSLLFKYVPTLKDDPRAQYVADEFQIQSVETVGNELVEELMTFLLPAIMEYQEVRIEQPTNMRVESSAKEEEEEDESIDDSQIRKVA